MRGWFGGLAGLGLFGVCAPSLATPPEATAYQITVDHAGVTTSGGALALQETPLWSITTLPAGISYPIIAGGAVYVTVAGTPGDATPGTTLYAFNAQSGAALWPNPVALPSTTGQWSNLTYDAGKLFALSYDGTLRYFDAATGTAGPSPWPVSIGGADAPPTASNGVVYVSGFGGFVRAFRESDGTQIWVQGVGPASSGDSSSPAVGPNGVYVHYSCPHVYAFDLLTGGPEWTFPQTSNCSGGGGSAPVYANGSLYVRDVIGNTAGANTAPQGYILNAADGTQHGSFTYAPLGPLPAITATTGFYLEKGPPIVLNAVDLTTNTPLWSFTGDGSLSSAPLVVDDEVIIGSTSGLLWALDATTGTVVWKEQLPGIIAAPNEQILGMPLPGLAVADGVLVVPLETSLGQTGKLVAYSIFGPPGPTGLVATGKAGAVQLDWTAAPTAATYEVYMGSASRTEDLTPVQSGLNTTTTIVTGLTAGATYYFKVKARSSTGISAPSNEASATPHNPVAPTNLVASAGAASVVLTWSPSADAGSYNVYAGTTAGGESATPVATGITGTTLSINSLAPGSAYYYTVKTVAGNLVSSASNEASATPSTLPPTNLTATAGIGTVSLNWSAVSGATMYNIYQGTASGSESATAVQTGVVSTTINITGLTAGTTYYFLVRAVAASTVSGASNETSATPQAPQPPPPPPPPPAPANLTATAGIGKVSLSWSAVSGAISYNVYQGTASGSESATAVQTGIVSTTVDITGLTGGTTYYFVVKAVAANGVSKASNEASATPQAQPPTSPPDKGGGGGALDWLSLVWLGGGVASALAGRTRRGRPRRAGRAGVLVIQDRSGR